MKPILSPRRAGAALTLAACLAACAAPPRSAYTTGPAETRAATLALGANEAGEPCTQDGGPGETEAALYCGTWQQPSAHVALGTTGAATAAAAAASGPWRDALDRRLDCGQVQPATILGRYPAALLACTTRLGGWPQTAIAAQIDGRIWLADGVRPALPAMERSIGILSGKLSPNAIAAAPVSASLAAKRLAAKSFGSGDIGQYQSLMRAANRANTEGNFAAAEDAYRAAAALQERVQGADSPALARTLSGQALQLSNQGRFAEADALFARAQTLSFSPKQTDPLAPALQLHYRGLHLLNQSRLPDATATLRQAQAAYAAQLPAASLVPAGGAGIAARLDNQQLLDDDTQRRALLGVIETRRAEARALRLAGQTEQGATLAQSATALAEARGIEELELRARLFRTAAFIDDAQGHKSAALSNLTASAEAFSRALPGSRTYAETTLLVAGGLQAGHRTAEALAACRTAATVLRQSDEGTNGEWLQPCLAALADGAAHAPDPASAQALLAEMFEMGQLARSSITSQQISQASARLAENARDPRVAALIRARDDQTADLAALLQSRDDARTATGEDAARQRAALQKQIDALQAKQAQTEQSLQAASPNYSQLVQQVVSARNVLAALHPGEAFLATMLSQHEGWAFLLSAGQIRVAPIEGGSLALAALVRRVRASLDAEAEPPPPFDIEAAQKLYDLVLRGVAPGLQGANALSVAPTGPLLSLPFGMLLTGPAQAGNLAAAPWLIQQLVVEHVPAPANFISLRKLAGTSRATRPWFGFGDFRPVSLAQAERSFPSTACADSATLLAGLPPLPGAIVELAALRQLTGAAPTDELLGPAFTAAAVSHAPLKDFRVLHFATHALLPTDLRCQSEPAIVTSAAPTDATAAGALLTASDVAGLDLDADAVILSACNTGGPGGTTSGESLTGLARSFFYAGARALLITHWSVNDRTTAYLVALTLSGARSDPGSGLAGALAHAQRRLLADAKGDLAVQAHPFYWAALAVIGEGMGSKKAVLF